MPSWSWWKTAAAAAAWRETSRPGFKGALGGGQAVQTVGGGKARLLRVLPQGLRPQLHGDVRKGGVAAVGKGGGDVLLPLMAGNVEKTYGKSRFPNMDLCAKSGTAEVGEGLAPHAWLPFAMAPM